MTLTQIQIYERYSEIDFDRTIYIKRRNTDGTYESTWQDLEQITSYPIVLKDTVEAITKRLPNDDYSAGTITVDNVTLKVRNDKGWVSNEDDSRSIFFGYTRHKSLVKIEDGFIDKYTDPDNPVAVVTETFLGFIDDTQSDSSFDNVEVIVVTDQLTTLLQELTIDDLGSISYTTLEDFVFAVMNRDHFKDFFTVSSGNINAGFNFAAFDHTQYDGGDNMLDVFQDFSIDHSVPIVQEGVFYYKAFVPSVSVLYNFDTTPERKGSKFKNFNSGAKQVRDKLYWEGTNISKLAADRLYNKEFKYDIKGVTGSVDRQAFLDWLIASGGKADRKESFTFSVKFFPGAKILDKRGLLREGFLPEDAWVIGNIRLGTSRFKRAIGSIQIPASEEWMIRGIKHDKKLTTWLTVKKV